MEQGTNNQVKSKRDAMVERMRAKYPEENFDDEEVFYGKINDDYDDYDKQLGEYKEREGQFVDMFSKDPRSVAMFRAWKEGSDPAVELVRRFGTDVVDAVNDPEKQEEIAEANKEFLDRLAKSKELDEEYASNLDESLKMMADYQAQNGMSDDEVDEAMSKLIGIVRDGVMGKFSAESLDMVMKAVNHDVDVANAEREAEVRGRNTKIEEKLRKPQQGDGVSNLNGKNGRVNNQPQRKSIFDLARDAR